MYFFLHDGGAFQVPHLLGHFHSSYHSLYFTIYYFNSENFNYQLFIVKFKERYVLEAEILENEYFVGWGTLALINAGLAQGKNRTGLNWFLLSLILGPLATLILLFVGKRPHY